MRFRALQQTHLLAAVVFVGAVLVLTVQLVSPSPVVVSLGESGTQTTHVGEFFTYLDVSIAVASAFLAGISGTYLVVHDQTHVLASQEPAPAAESRPPAEPNGGPAGVSRSADPAAESSAEDRWEDTLERLANNEETIYGLLLESDGTMAQRKLVEETDLSKATVSRTLDKLEHRGLVERKRDGMGNTIRLQ
ncbi:helix-turn-helix transcriptional regulator [Haloarcula litorea]|uniref:helix-turn-helix transcriptional regulator n=1 Tax=Haloarcula litorea TaxID=3032579 RepID=UPI0023E79311|nr:MarR family transcriptional regulator [Halomicroarcula sp. GDY20]